MLLVCQTLMPDLGRTRPDAAPDAGRRPRAPAGLQPGLPAQGRFLGQGRAAPRTVVLGGVGGIHPSLLAGSRVRGGGGSPAARGDYGRARLYRRRRRSSRRPSCKVGLSVVITRWPAVVAASRGRGARTKDSIVPYW